MKQTISTYYESALGYLDSFYHSFSETNFNFGFSFIKRLSEECIHIAKDENLHETAFDNALLATCFRYAGVTNIMKLEETGLKLLTDFTEQVGYPADQVPVIEEIIEKHYRHEFPTTTVEKVVWDALNYRFAMDDLLVHVSFLRDEMNRLNETHIDEITSLSNLRNLYPSNQYYTAYGIRHFSEDRAKNLNRIEKRIERLTSSKSATKDGAAIMTDKETEDLFKIAFRNYNKLVGVADSKAGLLIHINSILISVVIGFVVSRSDKFSQLFIPSFIVLTVAFITILLGILASRPQKNAYIQDKSSRSYQTFFFGSFDLIGTEFKNADFDSYSTELDTLFKGGKEKVYSEIYKEVFNVRKVLSKKFTFLSYAYMIFLGGLFVSIIAFFISIENGDTGKTQAKVISVPHIHIKS